MASRPRMSTTTTLAFPLTPATDVSATVRAMNELLAQATRLWIDLWFANLNRASSAFWEEANRR